MQPFTIVSGAAAALPAANIDTDVIMPKQFLKGIDRTGLRDGAFFDLRFSAPGQLRPDFVLNRPEWMETRFLVVGENFGCGSSREHAVWGLLQIGIRAIIGTSFAGIFADNAANNGLLLIEADTETVSTLGSLAADPRTNRLTVDLMAQTIASATRLTHRFDIPPLRKDALVRGLDTIGTTLEHATAIHAFEQQHFAANPWFT